jgi:IS1 family transposase
MDCPHEHSSSRKKLAVISALTDGCSIRATERLTGIHRDTIMRLGVRVGDGCAVLHNEMMQFVQVNRLELDELWSFVGKKQRKVKPTDPTDLGDQYVFIGIDATRKAIISYLVGKRDGENTNAFLADLRQRIVNRPEISSDGWSAYPDAVERAFGIDCTFAHLIKQYQGEPGIDAARRYSPGVVVGVQRRWVIGAQRKISTSYVERGNLSVRMASRRFTRLTNGFSKKLENHVAAVSLYVAHFNLCRVHESLRITPAMAISITDHIWTIGELINAATTDDSPAPPFQPFTVIQGGRK